jgi:hypothetical protein
MRPMPLCLSVAIPARALRLALSSRSQMSLSFSGLACGLTATEADSTSAFQFHGNSRRSQVERSLDQNQFSGVGMGVNSALREGQSGESISSARGVPNG